MAGKVGRDGKRKKMKMASESGERWHDKKEVPKVVRDGVSMN